MQSKPIEIPVPEALARLYAHSDRERFPASMPTDRERESTLYYADFKTAEAFGLDAVRDTLRNCGPLEQLPPLYATELATVANHLLWECYQTNPELADIYRKIWDTISDLARTWDEADALHFWQVTD